MSVIDGPGAIGGAGVVGAQGRPAAFSSPSPSPDFVPSGEGNPLIHPVRSIYVVADYGRPGDPAFTGVFNRVLDVVTQNGLAPEHTGVSLVSQGVAPFDTLAGGFALAMLADGANHAPAGSLIVYNVAPRFDRPEARLGNEGERFLIGRVPGRDVTVIATEGGYSLSALSQIPGLQLRVLPIDQTGSQFRSRDAVAPAYGKLLSGEVGWDDLERIDLSTIPPMPLNQVAEWDGYGNGKLTNAGFAAAPGTDVVVVVQFPRFKNGMPKAPKMKAYSAKVAGGSFHQPDGTYTVSQQGSSVLSVGDGYRRAPAEVFLRGGAASGPQKPRVVGGYFPSGAEVRLYNAADGSELRPLALTRSQLPLVDAWQPGPDLSTVLATSGITKIEDLANSSTPRNGEVAGFAVADALACRQPPVLERVPVTASVFSGAGAGSSAGNGAASNGAGTSQ